MSGHVPVTVILPPAYLPPAAYFAAIASADYAVIDTSMRFDKRRKSLHRTILRGAMGSAYLTVPVGRPALGSAVDAAIVSGHGNWWHNHAATLATLFGATPFYHLYAAELSPLLQPSAVGRPVTDLDVNLIVALCRMLGISTPLSVKQDAVADSRCNVADLRRTDFYALPAPDALAPGLSVLEPLFALGGAETHKLLVLCSPLSGNRD